MEPRGVVVKEAEGFQDLILEEKNKGRFDSTYKQREVQHQVWVLEDFAPSIPDGYIHGSLIPLTNNILIYHTYTQYSSSPIASTQRKHMEHWNT